MTEKERYIKQAFKNYNENKKRLKELSFDCLRAVDYSRPCVSRSEPQSNENEIIRRLNRKQKFENQVQIVDKTIEFFKIQKTATGEQHGQCDYIQARFIWGKGQVAAAMDCYVCERTGRRWLKEIYQTAAVIADTYGLWG